MPTSFADRLKAARVARGLSQKALGLQIGLDPSVASTRMNQYERAKHVPSFQTVTRMAAVLSLPATWFYAEDDDEARWIEAWSYLAPADRALFLEMLEQTGRLHWPKEITRG